MSDILKQLDAAAELGKAATKRPWAVDKPSINSKALFVGNDDRLIYRDDTPTRIDEANAAYIVASAGLDHAAVAAELRAKDAEIERLRALICPQSGHPLRRSRP